MVWYWDNSGTVNKSECAFPKFCELDAVGNILTIASTSHAGLALASEAGTANNQRFLVTAISTEDDLLKSEGLPSNSPALLCS